MLQPDLRFKLSQLLEAWRKVNGHLRCWPRGKQSMRCLHSESLHLNTMLMHTWRDYKTGATWLTELGINLPVAADVPVRPASPPATPVPAGFMSDIAPPCPQVAVVSTTTTTWTLPSWMLCRSTSCDDSLGDTEDEGDIDPHTDLDSLDMQCDTLGTPNLERVDSHNLGSQATVTSDQASSATGCAASSSSPACSATLAGEPAQVPLNTWL